MVLFVLQHALSLFFTATPVSFYEFQLSDCVIEARVLRLYVLYWSADQTKFYRRWNYETVISDREEKNCVGNFLPLSEGTVHALSRGLCAWRHDAEITVRSDAESRKITSPPQLVNRLHLQ